jgi:hypothetical protein
LGVDRSASNRERNGVMCRRNVDLLPGIERKFTSQSSPGVSTVVFL